MNILLCVHHRLDANTGAPGVTLQLGAEFEALGHSVAFVSIDDLPGRIPDAAAELLFPEAAAWLLSRRAGAFDIVDATTGDAWLWASMRRRDRPRLVTRSHGLEHVYWASAAAEARAEGRTLPLRTRLYHGRWRLREVAASLRSADACTFLNQADLDHAVARLGVARERASVVPNGIPRELEDLPRRPAREPIGIAVIGTWASRKGARYAAAALTAVLERRADVSVLLLGTKVPERQVLADFGPSVRERVRVVESYGREELPALLAGSALLVSAALAEGFGLGILEGMAAGLAPVSTGLPGPREFVRDGENGLLVPPGDAGALEAALVRLLDDRPLLERLRSAAHASAQELTWRRIAERNLELYERCLR